MNALNNFLLIGLPYAALSVFLIGTIWRYRSSRFSYSSLSSELLERRALFWGSVPFHYGLLFLFFGHLVAFLIPSSVLAWNSHPVRLLVLEITAFAFGITTLWGLGVLLVRRLSSPRLRAVTNVMDVTILVLLLGEVVLGLWTAIGFRWGSSWFAAVLTPYLQSLFLLQPDTAAAAAMPLVVKLHIAFAFVILGLIPFTRLVHVLVTPLHYVWRPFQRVIWNWNREELRNPRSVWERRPPRNS